MTSVDDVIAQLSREIAARAKLEPDEIELDAHFVIDLGLSSLDVLSVLAFAEKSLSLRFPDEQLSELTTLDNVLAAIRAQQQSSS